ncbi:hypothetical protein NL676_023731 [Syzygium grande]|nr:hypothetical protein NL676_023731 [Syzygium grande]
MGASEGIREAQGWYTLRPCYVVSVIDALIVSMAFHPPTRLMSTYGSVLDIDGSFIERLDPVIPEVVWERHLTIVLVDCFIPVGRMPFHLVTDYFCIGGRLFGTVPYPCESVRRFVASG